MEATVNSASTARLFAAGIPWSIPIRPNASWA